MALPTTPSLKLPEAAINGMPDGYITTQNVKLCLPAIHKENSNRHETQPTFMRQYNKYHSTKNNYHNTKRLS